MESVNHCRRGVYVSAYIYVHKAPISVVGFLPFIFYRFVREEKKRKSRIKDSANKPYRTAYVDEYINMERKIYTLVLVSCG